MLDAAWALEHEATLRFAVFAGVIALFAAAEFWRPALPRLRTRMSRWKANLGLGAASSVALRVLLPGAAVLAAVWAQMRGWGALNQFDLPLPIACLIAMTLLDLALYAQHVVTHRVPLLWRLHQVHHADREIDVTTAIRFHPVEMVASQVWKVLVVIALGAPPLAVVAFEILLNASAMFNHANLKLPKGLDAILRALIVTPDVHRIHHSTRREENDSNFGFCLSVWDRAFGTYRAAPTGALEIGLPDYRDERPSSLVWSLAVPFWSPKA